MALIKCTECGKEFSDKASNCPNCGCPIEDVKAAIDQKEKEKEQKKVAKESKPKKEIKPEQKKKIAIISVVSVIVLAIALSLGWYYGIIVPRDKAFSAYSDAVAIYNEKIDGYNTAVLNYNEKANEIIAANDEYSKVIDSAQAVIDSGDTPYEGDKMVTLSNTLKDARNNKANIPSLYEKIDNYNIEETLAKSSVKVIDEATGLIESKKEGVIQETDYLVAETEALIVPDYSSTISTIEIQQKDLEDSILIQKQITNPTQDWVLSRLNNVENIANIACATEENDPNNKLGKDGGYTAQIYYSSPLLGTQTTAGDKLIDAGTDAGGSIEVYKTVEDAEGRNTYLASFDGTIFDSGKHIVVGTMVVRVSTKLTASKQEQFINEIIDALIAP